MRDIPVEMLVYTQTAPDVPDIMGNIERLAEETGKGRDISVRVDSTDGYSWPWAWYLRDYRNVSYPCWSSDAGCQSLTQSPEADVILLAARNQPASARYLTRFQEGERYKHRWWFPENYRELTPAKLASGFSSRESWCTVVSYSGPRGAYRAGLLRWIRLLPRRFRRRTHRSGRGQPVTVLIGVFRSSLYAVGMPPLYLNQ